jgi:hypothetical protein
MSSADTIDDYHFRYHTFRPRDPTAKVPGGRRRVAETVARNPSFLTFPPDQNGQREITYETACCNGPSTFVMTGRKIGDDMTVLSPGLLLPTARVPRRTTGRIEFNQTEN